MDPIDYKQQAGNSRQCVQCGRWHDTILEDRGGKRLHEFDKCEHCLFAPTLARMVSCMSNQETI